MSEAFMATILILAGFTLAGLGGEAFVRGSVSLAQLWRIPTAIIGVTIAAFATSSPELSVAISAASAGKPGIALGDAVGSNITNIALILGIALCFGNLPAHRTEIRRDWLVALSAPLLIGVMALDGVISRFDGIILWAIFAGWLGWVITHTMKNRQDVIVEKPQYSLPLASLFCAAGMGLLVLAGVVIVMGAKKVGVIFGISPFIIGVTLVALGTSMPELATTLIARLRGHHDMGLGTVLGSNVFNIFVIVATAALIHPIEVQFKALTVALAICIVTTLLSFPNRSHSVPRWRGVVLLGVYGLHVLYALGMES